MKRIISLLNTNVKLVECVRPVKTLGADNVPPEALRESVADFTTP